MPYSVEQSASCPASRPWGVIKDDGEVMGCHSTQADAEAQQAALYASEPQAKYESINFSPPQGVREEAKRGLEWRKEHNRGGTAVGVARARDLSNGKNISPETARRMKAYFDRHEVDKQGEGFSPGEDGFPSAGRIAWALWGGDAGQAWANKLVRQMNAEDNAKGYIMAAASPNEIKLYGPIGYPGITAEQVKRQLDVADRTQPLVVRIDSEGGSVFDGMSIYDAIANWEAGSKVIIESAAFSIASFIAMAGDSIEITENGYVMIHNPYTGTEGDSRDHRKAAEILDKLESSMLAAYSERTGMTPEEVRGIMAGETWYTAIDAKAAGLVDSILSTKKQSRLIESQYKMPTRVCASLKVSEHPVGDVGVPEEIITMATEKIAATAKAIKAKYGKTVSDKLIVKAMEEEMSMDDVAELLMEQLQGENEELKMQLAAAQEELVQAKAQMEEMAKAQEQPKEEPAMKARVGIRPVASTVAPVINARAKWDDCVANYVAKGMDKATAVRRVNRENPGLREQMLNNR